MKDKSNLVNITPIMEQMFGVSKITNKKDLDMLIAALREDKGNKMYNTKNMAALMQTIQKKMKLQKK